jgi:putative oxidoreductase
MERYLGRWSSYVYAVLRIVAGFLFFQHGAQKILGMLGGMGGQGATAEFLTRAWFAGIIELVGGAMIAVGWLTGWVAFLCSGEMAFAYFLAHAPQGFWPLLNRGELAALYCFLFLYMAARGAGPLSVDALLGAKSRR